MLEASQTAMMQALEHGPGALPDGLFAGQMQRILAGMKVHANTISHARLVALEDTFPRTRKLIGHERFNALTRRFALLPEPGASPLARIGADFPGFLGAAGETSGIADLAAFEWLWLEAYHAAEGQPLRLADLAGTGETALLDLVIQRHPAASIMQADRAVHCLIGKEVSGLASADAILIARPDAEVLVSPATMAMAALLGALEFAQTVGKLLERFSEPGNAGPIAPDEIMPALIGLLEAGAILSFGQQEE